MTAPLTPSIESESLAELLYANSYFHEGEPNTTAQLMRDGAERIRQLESEVNTAKLGEEAMLICIQTACEVLGKQVQPAFLSDLVRERITELEEANKRREAAETASTQKAIYEAARHVGISGEKAAALFGTLEMCGYVLQAAAKEEK